MNTTNLEGYDEKLFDVDFSEPIVVQETPKDTVVSAVTVIEPIKESVKEPIKTEIVSKMPVLKPNSSLQEKIKYYSELYGDVSAEGLQFRVQIAAYKYPKNYTYKHLNGLGEVENILLDDGITRITIGGNFSSLAKAFEHNIKVIKAGQTDAFVTVIYKGKRIYLEDLEKMGIFVKK
jgi:hypothetical protein